jgi:SRSO17 transposase
MAILIQASLVRGLAVFGVLAKGRFATAIDTRLYLPKKWTDDQQRCNKAGIPESEQVFKTKNQLALEIVEQARRNGVRFGWVGADAGYGSGPDFLFALDNAGHTFLVDVHKSFVVYELDPQPTIPVLSSKGSKARRSITGKKGLSVEELVESCSSKDWKVCNVRETTRGTLKLRVLRKSVEVWDKQSEQARRYQLLVTENLDGEDRKYSLLMDPTKKLAIDPLSALADLADRWSERVIGDPGGYSLIRRRRQAATPPRAAAVPRG